MTPITDTQTVEKNPILKDAMVIGKGHLGTYLRNAWGCQHWVYDMDDLTEDILKDANPSFIVNAAGKTDLNWIENNKEESFRSNVIAPLELYRRVENVFGGRIRFFMLSSGCLFDGPYDSGGKPFEPYSRVTPACFYTWTKACCDAMLFKEGLSDLIILRPRQLYSGLNSSRNTLVKLLKYEKLLNTSNSMTSVRTVRRFIEKYMGNMCRDLFIPKIFNIYEKQVTSPFQVGTLLYEAGLRNAPQLLSKNELDAFHKPKRVDTVLYDYEFENEMGDSLPNVEDELKYHINELKENLNAKK